MAGQSRKWTILVATIWIQAFTGTNFDFPAYSSDLKAVLGISQVQLNYLAVASDLGKVFGWSSGLALLYLPLWVVLFIAAFMGLFGYGLQWLLIRHFISLPYLLVFLLCLLAGCSICWFNTVCFVLCIRNFAANRPLALSLTVSFNGVSAALYALADGNRRDALIFLILNFLAILTGVYLLVFGSTSSSTAKASLHFGGAILLLISPLCIPGVVYARNWFHRTIHSSFSLHSSSFLLIGDDELELHKELLTRELSIKENGDELINGVTRQKSMDEKDSCCDTMVGKDRLAMLGEEHPVRLLVRRVDFWLYYIAYICGGTIGLVYSNNLGQIAQSLGQRENTARLLTLYSSFSFFGRLLSAAPDYIRVKLYFARTAWLTIALVPTPIAFFLLAVSSNPMALQIGTALVGLSSGFIFAAAVSITSELFGPNSVGVNHNILITNIPVGSLIYGLLAAIVYDANALPGLINIGTDSVVCMGRRCYFLTFVWWGCISVVGLASSFLLFLRTKHAYDQFELKRVSTLLY